MKFSERLRIYATRIKSYFVNDQVRNFVLFLEDFFPSEKIFGLYGFSFFDGLQTLITQVQQQRRKNIFWGSVVISLVILLSFLIKFLLVVGKSENFILSIEAFGWISGYGMTMLKIFLYYYWKNGTIINITERLDRYFPHSSREQLKFEVPKYHSILKILYYISFTAHVLTWTHFSCMTLLSTLFGQAIQFFAPIYFPLDQLHPWLYLFIYFIQVYSLLFIFFLQFAIDSFFCSLVCVTSMNFDVLAQKLSKIDPENDENAEKKLQKIIDGYNELTDIANELEDIFSPLLLLHFFGGIFILCACVFVLFVPLKFYLVIKHIPLLPMLLIQLFCICFYGDKLQTSSMRVAVEAYNCNWHGKNLKFRKMILLTMLRAQRPQKLTGMKFMDVGLPVYYWLSERLRISTTQIKSYFVNDHVRNFVLFLEDFFPCEKMFRIFGFNFLHDHENPVNLRRQKQFFWTSVILIVSLTFLSIIKFLLIVRDSKQLVNAIETYLWMSGYYMVLVLIYFICSLQRNAIMKVIEKLDRHFPYLSRDQLQFKVVKNNRQLKILHRIGLFTYGWVWLHMTYMPLVQYIRGEKIELIYLIYFPFDVMQPLLYMIFLILQSWSLCIAVLMVTTTDSLFYSLVCVTSMNFDILAHKLSQIEPENDENAEKKLQEIIDGYNELTDIANELEEIFSPLLFVHIFAGITHICTSVFLLFTSIRFYLIIKYSTTVPMLSTHLFSLCFYGEQLQNSSMRVADEAYNCNWYGKNLKFRKMILLTMLRAQRPQKLTGMKFMDVGLPVYYWV
ncbi:hypothetical protein PVAND_003158 [Polypedilum vanderplanki]|uniref:Odorant receptor n=1 Tax=Polypedilum vanderplanki TaxID=319348 RepID=A0A9J6BU97_POLVA|nr:hypothetical protein PVAND_003158 [Polypedilum vanderplanki]